MRYILSLLAMTQFFACEETEKTDDTSATKEDTAAVEDTGSTNGSLCDGSGVDLVIDDSTSTDQQFFTMTLYGDPAQDIDSSDASTGAIYTICNNSSTARTISMYDFEFSNVGEYNTGCDMSFPGDYKGYITNGVMLSYDEITTQSLATYEPSGYTVPAGEAVSLIATSYLETSSCSDYNMEFPENETIEASYFVE